MLWLLYLGAALRFCTFFSFWPLLMSQFYILLKSKIQFWSYWAYVKKLSYEMTYCSVIVYLLVGLLKRRHCPEIICKVKAASVLERHEKDEKRCEVKSKPIINFWIRDRCLSGFKLWQTYPGQETVNLDVISRKNPVSTRIEPRSIYWLST